LIEALTLMGIGAARATPQDDSQATYAPKIEREMARVDWSQPAEVVSAMIRAYDPKPGAFTTAGGADVKMYGVQIVREGPSGPPGQILDAGIGGIVVGCGGGSAVRVIDVQPQGKRRMSAEEWTRGRGVAVGDVMG
jgi:methionyl-tRNA formyltransferase